jgi:hypothetical protein
MRTFVTLLSLAICTCNFAQKDKSIYLNWRDKGHENITFKPSELTYSEKGKFYYNISNDRDNLYIDLKIFDKDVQRQVLTSGLTVWINTNGKKGKKTGVRYPARTGNQEKPEMGGMPDQQSLQNNQRMGNMQSMQNAPGGMQGRGTFSGSAGMQTLPAAGIDLIRLGASDHIFIPAAGMNTFRGSMRFDRESNLWYELVFPLAKMPEAPDKKKNNNNGLIILGLSYPGINTPRMGEGTGGGPGDEGGGGRGGPGGGGMGGRGGGMGGRGGGGSLPSGGPGEGMGTAAVSPVIVWMKDVRFATEK